MINKSTPLFTLLPPFYDLPLYPNVNVYLERIEKELSIKVRKYSYLKHAFGNDVFIINDEIVFRFPREKDAINHLPYEIDLLKFLKDKVRINTPSYSYISRKKHFAGYNIIKGKILTPFLFKKQNKKDKEKIVNQLISFINGFHKIRLHDFEKYKPLKREYFTDIEKRIENEIEIKLFPKLPKKEVKIIRDFYNESKRLLQNIPNSCAIHGDLYAYNVIWDKNKQEVGVIDFSDYMIGDPARDFEVFFDFGPEYPETAFEKYFGPKDKDFLKRAKIYYKAHGIYTLLSSLLGAHISFNYAYSHFFKEKFRQSS